MFRKIFKISLVILIALGVVVFFLPKEDKAATRSPDIIGLRIIPNIKHLSAQKWYKEQKFVGSPQSLTVDGYEAVRDGRTVYVNIANIGSDDIFYTNINVISYNQEAEGATLDIFGQIVNHWKFNTNIKDEDKIEIIKDTARLAYLADVETALENYKGKHGFYPKLSAGSYLTNKTISTWPSWQGALGKELGITLPVDPVNKMGSCDGAGYNKETCWNDKDRKFSTNLPKLPLQSQVFYYSASTTNVSYNLCAVMTSGYISNFFNARACEGSNFRNHSPTIDFSACKKDTRINNAYSCQIKTFDQDGGVVTFVSLLSQPANFSLNVANGVISGTPDQIGTSTLKVVIKDNFEATAEGSYSLNVKTYCGDGKKQSPNMEGINEQCDNSEGTPANATCKNDCASWQCNDGNQRFGFHKENTANVCVSNTQNNCVLTPSVDHSANTTRYWFIPAVIPAGYSVGFWGDCQLISCEHENLNSGFHKVNNTCISNTKVCQIQNASSAQDIWANNAWGGCKVVSCNTGFHEENNNACVSNTRVCQIQNASSAQDIWANNAWGGCKVVSCNTGYLLNNNACAPPPIFARIVLSWGSITSRDLDAHLNVGDILVYYGNKSPDGAGAALGQDISGVSGLETITIYSLVAGANYVYHVDNFGDRSTMDAKVEIFNLNGTKIREYLSGTLSDDWYVFRMTDEGVISDY